jgi:glycosyltransferase involved in cell wall biosynthesis
VAVRNEEAHIAALLESIARQDYPSSAIEVLVLDGRSTDRTREIVTEAAARWPNVRLIDNPRRIQAAGWNVGIDAASGDILGIVSGHAELETDYVSTAVETLERTGADMVGGVMRALGSTPTARAIGVATSTPFGVGGARFHYADREERVDTVYMGLCRRDTYRRFRFDEEMVRDQDDELSYRMLDAGCVIVCNPAIRSRYVNRATFKRLFRQYHEYGLWKVRVMQKHPRQVRPRHLIPAAFVTTLAVTAALAPFSAFGRLGFSAAVGSYALAVTYATARWSPERSLAPYVGAAFSVLHVAYGTGFVRGLARFRRGWRRDARSSEAVT